MLYRILFLIFLMFASDVYGQTNEKCLVDLQPYVKEGSIDMQFKSLPFASPCGALRFFDSLDCEKFILVKTGPVPLPSTEKGKPRIANATTYWVMFKK